MTQPAVADAAVAPSRDAAAGEVPKAFVVLDTRATPAEIMEWLSDRVAAYKRVGRVEIIDQIPRSPSGKVLRRLLVERDRAQMEREAVRR